LHEPRPTLDEQLKQVLLGKRSGGQFAIAFAESLEKKGCSVSWPAVLDAIVPSRTLHGVGGDVGTEAAAWPFPKKVLTWGRIK